MNLWLAEKTMFEYIKKHIKKESSLSLVGEPYDFSRLKEQLEKEGYKVVEVFSEKNPINGRTHFIGEVVIGTRPCDIFSDKDISTVFLRACRYWNKYFILLPCNCSLRKEGFDFTRKITYYIRQFRNIESVDSMDNWIILHNLDDKIIK